MLLCCGKVYYDLLAERDKLGRSEVAIVRLEQPYPLSWSEFKAALAPYREGTPVVWVQEEPQNMGALPYLSLKLTQRIRQHWPTHSVSRPESASPATGSAASHRLEQQSLLDRAFGELG